MKLLLGDCLDKLKELDDNSVDSIVTDPPYGLSFMGKKWDYDVPSQEIFEECLRVLKPGGHLLSFAGSRTYHRMAVRVEDAGFEIRDQIMWIYGSGFPKSLNIGKAVDKKNGVKGDVIGTRKVTSSDIGQKSGWNELNTDRGDYEYREIMNEYAGWGTALKPAHEPIVMARKPLSEKTIVDNVLKWGTGGINIDDSRVGMTEEDLQKTDRVGTIDKTKNEFFIGYGKGEYKPDPQGRFPANIIFDEEAGKILDEQSGILKSGNLNAGHKRGVGTGNSYANGGGGGIIDRNYGGDEGGASRFFYCPKTSKTDRNEGLEHLEGKQVGTLNANSSDLENYGGSSLGASSLKGDHKPPQPKQNFHPTVKPTDLMLYLIRLVTPKGGTTLDPFMGSGSTGKAAVRGGFDFVGIEREDEYMEIAQTRIQYEQDNPYNEEKGERVEVNKNSNKFW
jgi:site-specific DNA-methyltransferase (adenine-specific)